MLKALFNPLEVCDICNFTYLTMICMMQLHQLHIRDHGTSNGGPLGLVTEMAMTAWLGLAMAVRTNHQPSAVLSGVHPACD